MCVCVEQTKTKRDKKSKLTLSRLMFKPGIHWFPLGSLGLLTTEIDKYWPIISA